MKTITYFLLFAIIQLLLSSCSQLYTAGKQKIKLSTSPTGANISINGQNMYLATPCEVEIKKKVKAGDHNSENEYCFLFTKEGYTDKEVIVKGQTNSILGDDLLGVIASRIKYKEEIFVTMQPTDSKTAFLANPNQRLSRVKTHKDNEPPFIKIISPDLEKGIKTIVSEKKLNILGKVEDKSGIYEVSVNNVSATFTQDGIFEAIVPIELGQNKIIIEAKDGKMNLANKSFYVERITPDKEFTKKDKKELDKFGTFYALIIGIQNYKDPFFNDLDQPISDASKLYNTLIRNYSFYIENIKFLQNPRRIQITEALEFYYNNVGEDDNLLVFYAGHGYWDSKFKQGYWLPSDAQEKNRGTWLSNSEIRDYIRAINSKHSLLITDACFAGGIFKSRNAFPKISKAIKQLHKLPSRKAMTSGAMNEVPDKSVFIEYLIKRLLQNQDKYLSSEQLFASFKLAVINNSQNGQVPQFGEIKETGDEGGDFIFIRK